VFARPGIFAIARWQGDTAGTSTQGRSCIEARAIIIAANLCRKFATPRTPDDWAASVSSGEKPKRHHCGRAGFKHSGVPWVRPRTDRTIRRERNHSQRPNSSAAPAPVAQFHDRCDNPRRLAFIRRAQSALRAENEEIGFRPASDGSSPYRQFCRQSKKITARMIEQQIFRDRQASRGPGACLYLIDGRFRVMQG